MGIITDFQAFIDCADLEDYEDVYCLYRSVKEITEYAGFSTTQKSTSKGNSYFVKYIHDDLLMLASEKARNYFMTFLEQKYTGDMDMEGWYAYKRAMAKND